jgi:feruloyl esterase
MTGSITRNIIVPNGASCTVTDASVKGSVQVLQNASLTVDATAQPTTIGGNVEAVNCASAILKGGVTVTGSVEIVQCAQMSGFIGPGVKIGGNFQCVNNAGGCEAELGDVQGNVQLVGSRATSDISLVSVGGNLQCTGNTLPPTHSFGPDFVTGSMQSQCAGNLGFASSTAAPICPTLTLATLNVPNLTVTSATVVQPTTITLPAGTFTVPQYCQVIGKIATSGECPTTGPFAAPSGPNLIGCDTPGSAEFRLKLPLVWNNHFVFQGCGGSCGSLATSVNPLDNAEALGLGYAVVNTDTGHEQDPTTLDYTWAVSESTPPLVNNTAIIDFYYRAVHQVTVATKQYVEAYYSQPIDYAYFDGCSTGGRQAMVEATHYPIDYDGVIAGDPAMAYHSLRTSTFKQAKAFIPTGAWIPYPSSAFPNNPNTVAAVDAAVMSSCDAVDGVVDGLIQNAAACNILPSALGPSGSGILTATQQAGLQAYVLLETDTPSGLPLFPGMPITDLSTAGFEGNTETTFAPGFPNSPEPWNLATMGQPLPTGGGAGPASWSLGEGGIKTYIEENQHFDVNDNWPETVSATGNTVSDATMALLYAQAGLGNSDDPLTLANFLKKGGKVIMYHGGSDSLITPFRTFWYYEQLASLRGGYGATQNSVRLFIEPGMGHCGGGSTQTPNSFDTLQALHNWVTKGVAPEGIVATATNGRTMPLCKFPEEASYSGSGNFNVATNWTCNPNDTRMLQVGTTGAASGAGAATAHQYLIDPIPIGLSGQ